MKKINKSSLSALLIIFGFFVMTLNFWDNPATLQPIIAEDGETTESLPNTSQFIPRTIRVAIYNEPNTTAPSYATGGGPALDNNYTGVMQLLQGAGYQVDELTCDDIINHKLMTADYDVFVMVDNLPKTNITDYVKEFWLGGGAILSFDSAILYLCYYGILIPESVGDHGWNTYYYYFIDNSHNISSRHPTTKDYEVNDKFSSTSTHSAYLNWSKLVSTSVGSEVVKLANRDGYNNDASAVALERDDKGGRIVQLPGRGNEIGTNMSDLIIDSVEWLSPRPKGRILFDLSHLNGYGVDTWDAPYVEWSTTTFSIMRDSLVTRSYTFDKLYPSALGNFTTENLAPYDLLIISLPDTNFTASEVTSVTNWVNNGGGLLALGDRYMWDGSKNLNYLLSSFDLSLIDDTGTDSLTTSFEHPTEEVCSSLTTAMDGLVNYTGNAYPLWGNSPTDIGIAGEEYGNGRVILTADTNLFDNLRIGLTQNLQFSINVANWLTSSQAKILLCINEFSSANFYVSPVARALNDISIPFALTFSNDYLNLSLHLYDWDLVIIDMPTTPTDLDIIFDYIDSGGRLIMSSYIVDDIPSHPLWAKLGFSFAADAPDDVPIYPWNPSHRIFTTPAPYGANNFTPVELYGDEGDLLTVYPNATALAGFTNTTETGNASIVLRNDGKTLYNAYLIDQFSGDVDDSTYADNFELWLNEIAFMLYQTLSVGISYPHTSDIFNATAPDFTISTAGMFLDDTWYTLNSGAEYHISSTSGTLNPGAWDGLPDGDVSLRFYVEDLADNLKYTTVNIVKDSQGPNITITSPIEGDTFSTTAPSFIVEITDEHLDKMWYILNSGSTKYFFTANGSIDQSAWDALADGSITIRFYANDTVNNEASVTIYVDISTGGNGGVPGGIPSYNAYILIGVIFVISAIIVKRQIKQNKFKN
jgi:hypothetical protein